MPFPPMINLEDAAVAKRLGIHADILRYVRNPSARLCYLPIRKRRNCRCIIDSSNPQQMVNILQNLEKDSLALNIQSLRLQILQNRR